MSETLASASGLLGDYPFGPDLIRSAPHRADTHTLDTVVDISYIGLASLYKDVAASVMLEDHLQKAWPLQEPFRRQLLESVGPVVEATVNIEIAVS